MQIPCQLFMIAGYAGFCGMFSCVLRLWVAHFETACVSLRRGKSERPRLVGAVIDAVVEVNDFSVSSSLRGSSSQRRFAGAKSNSWSLSFVSSSAFRQEIFLSRIDRKHRHAGGMGAFTRGASITVFSTTAGAGLRWPSSGGLARNCP